MNVNTSNQIVVKVSGSLLDDLEGMDSFWTALQSLQERADVVLVHGGGKQMSDLADRLGHTPKTVQGRRITTDLDLEIAQWAMGGTLNTQLVAQAKAHGLTAVGLTGADASLVRVTKRPDWDVNGETVDFGWVGDIEAVDPTLVEGFMAQDIIPVVAPLGIDDGGQVYNVNADTVACALAGALEAQKLLFVTGAGGVRRDATDPTSRLETCDIETAAQGVADGWIEGGMRVKVETALEALQNGVGQAFVCAADDLLDRTSATEVVA